MSKNIRGSKRAADSTIPDKKVSAPPEERVSKICWNYNGWRKPSGLNGKSRDKKSYERMKKFGHEEWLFDFDKLIDGYHFAALQPIGKFRDTYIGGVFNIALYSVNSNGAQWHWVAEIRNVEAIDRELEAEAIEKYRETGWLDEMASDLKAVGADEKRFLASVRSDGLFNVKFRPEDVLWFGAEPVPFGEYEKISHTRYTLLSRDCVKSDRQLPSSGATKSVSPELKFSGKTKKERNGGKREPNQQTVIQCLQLHTDIQNSLLEYLKLGNHGHQVELEVGKTDGGSIDLVMRRANGKNVFYEVKTYASAKMSIREAVGQLMEYSYYPDCVLASELIIVSQAPLDEDGKRYIKMLNKKFSIPISYMQFNHLDAQVIALHGK